MSVDELKKEGWNVSTEGFNIISKNDTNLKIKSFIANALNIDIKDFGEAILSKEIKQNQTGKIILQIQKIRNISAPKTKENSQAAPRMLKLILTDGHTTCQAVEISSVPSLSYSHTSPGSKLLINCANIFSSCILLHPGCCTLLGGQVPALYEKWEVAKNISEHVRSLGGTDGPPPWVNFGERIVTTTSNEPFKSLIDKTTKDTTNEFDVHRQDAISSASTGAVKKVFGGGTKVAQSDNQVPQRKYNDNSNKYESRGFRGKREVKEKVVEKSLKPPEKVSLFDFLEDKLVVDDVKSNNNKSFVDNNFVKSEASLKYGTFSGTNPSKFQNKYAGNTLKTNYNKYNNPIKNNYYTSEHIANRESTNSLESVNKDLGKMSVNSQFASRTLQQHLNVGNNRNESAQQRTRNPTDAWLWNVGDLCMAKYWEDGKYYNASITNLTERTCVVKFNGYGNVEEVLKVDCIPITDFSQEPNASTNNNSRNNMGFRSNKRIYSNTQRPFHKAT